MKYIKKEFKKLFPISVFVFLFGLINSVYLGLALIGLFLLSEHMYSYGRWDVFDILGHETFGIILLVGGVLFINIYYAIICLITYFIFGNYNWEEPFSPLEYAYKKIK